MVRKCATLILISLALGNVARAEADNKAKFVEVTIRELEESQFFSKVDSSVILFGPSLSPEPPLGERVRRAGNAKKYKKSKKKQNSYQRGAKTSIGRFGGWTSWGQWNRCSTTCGEGFRLRRRFCANASAGKDVCPGSSLERSSCGSNQNCDSYTWGRFVYKTCSKSCGGGTTVATRQCFRKGTNDVVSADICNGTSKARVQCNTHRCTKIASFLWAPFEYGPCDVTCGNGVQVGFRSCLNQITGQTVDEANCDGDSYISRTCKEAACIMSAPSPSQLKQVNIDETEGTCGTVPRNSGPRNVQIRISGGDNSLHGEWPWQVSLQHRTCNYNKKCVWKHLCGGSIIDNKWIVTAAHCVEESGFFTDNNNPGDDWAIVVGMNKLNYNHKSTGHGPDGHRILLEKIIPYPEYRFQYITHHDVAMIKLRTDISYDWDVQPICLGGGRKPNHGQACHISGWGYTTGNPKDNKLSHHLKDAEIPIVRFSECRRTGIWYKLLNENSHMCAGDKTKTGLDSCGGDSGGPLSCKDPESGQYYLAGVTSFGFSDCGKAGHLGIYANMVSYEKWINQVIKADLATKKKDDYFFDGFEYYDSYRSGFSKNSKGW